MHRLTGFKRIVATIVGVALLSFSAASMSGDSTAVVEGSKAASTESCVAPTDDMRRNHMEYLKHERDETVREGVRGGKFSIAECVSCHAGKDESGKYVPVNAEHQFCDSCHNYAAVKPTCFQCHRKVPEEK
jgi:hypothetical protein